MHWRPSEHRKLLSWRSQWYRNQPVNSVRATQQIPKASTMPSSNRSPLGLLSNTTIAMQVTANGVTMGFDGAGGYLEMNVYKPPIIFNITPHHDHW